MFLTNLPSIVFMLFPLRCLVNIKKFQNPCNGNNIYAIVDNHVGGGGLLEMNDVIKQIVSNENVNKNAIIYKIACVATACERLRFDTETNVDDVCLPTPDKVGRDSLKNGNGSSSSKTNDIDDDPTVDVPVPAILEGTTTTVLLLLLLPPPPSGCPATTSSSEEESLSLSHAESCFCFSFSERFSFLLCAIVVVVVDSKTISGRFFTLTIPVDDVATAPTVDAVADSVLPSFNGAALATSSFFLLLVVVLELILLLLLADAVGDCDSTSS